MNPQNTPQAPEPQPRKMTERVNPPLQPLQSKQKNLQSYLSKFELYASGPSYIPSQQN